MDSIGGGLDPDTFPAHINFTGVDRLDPKNPFDHLGAAGPHQPGQPQNLPAVQVKADTVHKAAAGQVAHRQDNLPDRRFLLGEEIGQLSPDHHRDQAVAVGVGRPHRGNVLPIPKDRDLVGNLEDLIHLVGDVDDGHPLRFERANHPKQMGHLAVGDGRGRLIHDDQT